MPTYDYRCEACGNEFEEFQSITAQPLKKCPKCGKSKLVRLIGTGAGVIFKGSGFYETDYRSDSYKKAAEAEKGGGAKTETKTDASPSGDAGGKTDSAGKTDHAAKSTAAAKPAPDKPASPKAEKAFTPKPEKKS